MGFDPVSYTHLDVYKRQREYKIYVHKKDADMARHILKYGDNR